MMCENDYDELSMPRLTPQLQDNAHRQRILKKTKCQPNVQLSRNWSNNQVDFWRHRSDSDHNIHSNSKSQNSVDRESYEADQRRIKQMILESEQNMSHRLSQIIRDELSKTSMPHNPKSVTYREKTHEAPKTSFARYDRAKTNDRIQDYSRMMTRNRDIQRDDSSSSDDNDRNHGDFHFSTPRRYGQNHFESHRIRNDRERKPNRYMKPDKFNGKGSWETHITVPKLCTI